MKVTTSKPRIDQDMASEYRFDYGKAKPNRFAERMNLNVGWTAEKFVEGEKGKKESGKKKELKKVTKAKPVAKAKAKAPAKKLGAKKKPAAKAKPKSKKKK